MGLSFQGLKLLKRCGPCYIYVGPNAFDTWEGNQLAAQGGDCVRTLTGIGDRKGPELRFAVLLLALL